MYAKYAKQMALPSSQVNKYPTTPGQDKFKLKPHHHVRLDAEFKADCNVWLLFLETEQDGMVGLRSINRPMVDLLAPALISTRLNFYSDASAAESLGYGCLFENRWLWGRWEVGYIRNFKPSIEYLELFALCAGILTWEDESKLQNTRITVFCDNIAVVHMINNLT